MMEGRGVRGRWAAQWGWQSDEAMGLVGLRRAPSWGWSERVEGVPRHPKLHRSIRAQYGGRLEGHLGVQLNLMGRHVLREQLV